MRQRLAREAAPTKGIIVALVALALLTPTASALLAGAGTHEAEAEVLADGPPLAPASQTDEHVVVAVIDTGINAYHEFFRAPALVDHPSTWLTGFPADATPLDLTFDAADVGTARDGDDWDSVTRTHRNADGSFSTHLYTFPGTRVVGAVSFSEYGGIRGGTPIFDDHGHGTHSAGLAAGFDMAAADANVLVVMVEVGQGDFDDGIRWAAEQPWIDALTISLGTIGNVPFPGELFAQGVVPQATRLAAESGKAVFVASGNGFTGTGLLPDGCSTYTSGYTGPPWVTRIGAAHPASENPSWWHCYPVEAIARTNVEAPDRFQYTGSQSASGTSAATPNAAGHYAHLVLEARREGATQDDNRELLDHLIHAIKPARPALGVIGTWPGIHGASMQWQGYGLVSDGAVNRALSTWLAGNGPTPRPDMSPWVETDRAIRELLWTEDSDANVLTSNDAGSGRDAGDSPGSSVPVDAGVVYDATLGGAVIGDSSDWFAFDADAGDVVEFRTTLTTGCFYLVNPDGTNARQRCPFHQPHGGTLTESLGESGTWFLRHDADVPEDYRFAYALNGGAPDPFA